MSVVLKLQLVELVEVVEVGEHLRYMVNKAGVPWVVLVWEVFQAE